MRAVLARASLLVTVVGAAALGACPSPQEGLVVHLQTDFVPGVEFGGIDVGVDGRDTRRVGVTASDSFARPHRVTAWTEVVSGSHVVTLSLILHGSTVVTRRAQVEITGSRLVTLIVSRTCGGVTCGDNETCSGGRCVEPTCVDGTEPTCPSPGCDVDSDCSSTTDCVVPSCSSSVCLETPSDARCGSGMLCVPGVGCVPRPTTPDAGMLDAGASVSCTSGAGCGDGRTCCDDGICRTACTAAPCAGQPRGALCRPATGPCDRAETCDGTSTACPADELVRAGDVCRPAVGGCDVAESCTGTSPGCPVDAFVPAGTACDGGSCDGLGGCSTSCVPGSPCGTGDPCSVATWDCGPARCVVRSAAPPSTVCRPASGACDRVETCGGSTTCPPDTFSSGVECRGSRGPCDIAEECDGSSAACPPDRFATGSLCRDDAGECDNREHCDGTGPDCPPDEIAGTYRQCRAAAGDCDVAENCDGRSAVCPADVLRGAGTECRAQRGVCDRAESCTGSSPSCPADELVSAGTSCRDGGECGITEVCDGSSVDCPPDLHRPAGTICREGHPPCDPAEGCTGDSDACPPDTFVPDGDSCDTRCGSEWCSGGVCVGGTDCFDPTPYCNCDNVCVDSPLPYCI
ncbi:MAG: hypothetical protein K1X94_02835 [Sandaracinaceae bacterium]|nr:hypothetical protein [Sandaracinaceae bacterium]